jgi:type IV pilus assembly protein PilE
MKKNAGVTLIELMIVVAIIGFLTMVALPTYTSYVLRSHRIEAINGLLDAASREARYYTGNNAYTQSMLSLGYATDPSPVASSSNLYYNISVVSVTADSSTAPASFKIQAVPQGSQTTDTCGTFTYTDMGVRTTSGDTVSNCWGK